MQFRSIQTDVVSDSSFYDWDTWEDILCQYKISVEKSILTQDENRTLRRVVFVDQFLRKRMMEHMKTMSPCDWITAVLDRRLAGNLLWENQFGLIKWNINLMAHKLFHSLKISVWQLHCKWNHGGANGKKIAGACNATRDKEETLSSQLKDKYLQIIRSQSMRNLHSYFSADTIFPRYHFQTKREHDLALSHVNHSHRRIELHFCQRCLECNSTFEEHSEEKIIPEQIAQRLRICSLQLFLLLLKIKHGNVQGDIQAALNRIEERNNDEKTSKPSYGIMKPTGMVFTRTGSSKTAKVNPINHERKTKNDGRKNKERTREGRKGIAKKGSKLNFQMMWCLSGFIFRVWLLFLYIALMTRAASASFRCAAHQVAELGKQGTIVCSFPETFHSVHWYDHAADGSLPLASYTSQTETKSDSCLENKSFDVSENGSLLICNVSLLHERNYTAVMYRDLDFFEEMVVSLIVVAYPGNRAVIVQCNKCYGQRYQRISSSAFLHCSFTETRPPVQLQWVERYPLSVTSAATTQEFTTSRNIDGTYNSSVTIRLLPNGDRKIIALACVATYHSFSSEWRRESAILLETSQAENFSSALRTTTNYLQANRRAEVQCGDAGYTFLIWKIISSNEEPETIGFKSYNLTMMTKMIAGVTTSSEGNLIFSSPQFRHEGKYACVYSDGEQDKTQTIDLILLIPPSPPFIKISGCDDAENTCILEAGMTQELTCSVDRFYPMTTLEWIANDPSLIDFHQSQPVSTKFDKLYSVSSTIKYSISDNLLCEEEIYIECRIQGPISHIMKSKRTAKLTYESCTMKNGSGDRLLSHWMLISSIITTISSVLLLVLICRNKCRIDHAFTREQRSATDLERMNGIAYQGNTARTRNDF